MKKIILLSCLSLLICTIVRADKLIGVGDSISGGYNLTTQDLFHYDLAQAAGITHQNFTIYQPSGVTTRDVKNNLTNIINSFAPAPEKTCVSVMIGTNDLLQPQVPVDEYESNLNFIFKSLKDAGADITALSPPYIRNNDSNVMSTNRYQKYQQALKRAALNQGVFYIDDHYGLMIASEQYGDNVSRFYWDNVHPNALGNQAIASVCNLAKNKDACVCKGY